MTTTETSLRVRFAKALGWRAYQCSDTSLGKWRLKSPWVSGVVAERFDSEEQAFELYGPDPTDANTVREALMGMTAQEWFNFTRLLRNRLPVGENPLPHNVIEHTLKTPPPTLAEIYCEVKLS